MQFLHALFLAGTATFAIPVLIHLIFRIRHRKVEFSSLRFLQQSVLKQSQRLRWRDLLLLLLRCAACILIALAFSRPSRPDFALAATGKLHEDLVLVLDDSPSLLAQDGPTLRWQSLLERVKQEIAAHPAGDRLGLVLASEPNKPEIELSSNFGAVAGALQRERPSFKRGDLAQALNTAVDLLASSTQPARRVVLYTDLQANQIERGAWATLAQKAATTAGGVSVQIQTPSGTQPSRLPNLAITDVQAKSDVWIEGKPIPFAVRLANYSDSERANLSVRLFVAGQVVSTRTVGLAPHASAEIELSAPLPHSGEISGWAEIDGHDAFPDDDRRNWVLNLRDSLRVTVIEDHLDSQNSFLDEGYYVRMALNPKSRDVAGQTDSAMNYVLLRSITSAQINADLCRNSDLIFLVGVAALNENELATLEDAVRDGLNLVIFTGRADGQLSESFYNGPFWKSGLGLLPARPGALYEGNRLEGRYHQLGEFKPEHPLFKTFAGENEPTLRLPKFIRHYLASAADLQAGATPPAGSPATPPIPVRPAGEVLATFSDGSPLAMERPFGRGHVLMFNFAPRPEATDLPKRKAFVPLIHQTLRHLAGIGPGSQRNLLAGERLDLAASGILPQTPLTLEKPGSKQERQQFTGADHPQVETPGVWTAAYQQGSVQKRTAWAVNLDPKESDLSCEDLATIREIFASNTIEPAKTNRQSEQTWDEEHQAQAPDWRYYLGAALVCLLLELLLRDFWN